MDPERPIPISLSFRR